MSGEQEGLLELLGAIRVGVACLDPDGTIVAANPAFEQLVSRRSVRGTQVSVCFGEEADRVRAALEKALIERLPEVAIEVTIHRANGDRGAGELSLARLGEPGFSGFAVTVVDRTPRVEAEAEAARLRALFEDIGELIGVMAPDGTVLSMNASARGFFGQRELGRGLLQFVPASVIAYLYDEIMPALGSDGRWEGEVPLLRHDGAEVLHHVTLRLHRGKDSDDPYFWAVARDRSMARRAAEADALSRLNESKDQFIASISHELRTPLTSIRGFADLVGEGGLGESEVAEYVELIRHEAYAMSAIVDDLLVAARVEAGHVSIVRSRLDMARIVDDVLTAMPSRGVIENRVSGPFAAVGDEMRSRQIIRNLVVNAVRHGGEHTWIECEATDEQVLVHVCDDGSGVDPAVQSSMFDAYVSRPNDGQRPESVGLGLTVSRQLARLMHGDVLYSFTGHARFTLALPRAED